MIRSVMLAVMLVSQPYLAISGVPTHEQKVQTVTNLLNGERERILALAAETDAALKAHGIVSPAIPATTSILERMTKDTAWRDLPSRTTRTHQEARSRLSEYLRRAADQLSTAQRQLATIKKIEYEEWARANPGAAKIKELEARTEAAEEAAAHAASEASSAQMAADDARREAAEAQWQAHNAQRRANRAQQETQANADQQRVDEMMRQMHAK